MAEHYRAITCIYLPCSGGFFFGGGGGYKDLQYLNHQKGLTLEGLSKAFKHIQTTEIKRCGTKAPQGDPGINSPLATTICFFVIKTYSVFSGGPLDQWRF